MENETIQFPKCNVCKKEMISDANSSAFCKLCGMPTKNKNRFCCEDCKNKLKQIKEHKI